MTVPPKKERYQALVLAHMDSAFNLAFWLARSRPDAEDIVQEACLRAYRFFDGFHGDDGRAWLLAIVRNTFYSWHKENRKQEPTMEFNEEWHSHQEAGPDHAADNPEVLLMYKDDQRLLQQAIEKLPLEFREVIVLRELEDLSYRQIAGIAGIPLGTVMSRLGRGRKLLAAMLASTLRDA
jgi:RNA polymerase sigma factor (sigma-70 family)